MIIQAYEHRWSSAGWLLVFLICLILLYQNRERWKRGYQLFFVLVTASSLLFLCPLFAKAVAAFLPGYLEYERITWLLFAVPLTAYVCVELLSRMTRKKQVEFISITLVLLLLLGDMTGTALFQKKTNEYKINENAVEIADSIQKDLQASKKMKKIGAAKVLYLYDTANLDADTEDNAVYYGIRQYTSALTLSAVSLIPYVTTRQDFVLAAYIGNDAQYIVCRTDEPYSNQLQNLRYKKIHQTGSFSIYKNVCHVTVYLVPNAQTEAEAQNILVGASEDLPMTKTGKETAQALGRALNAIDFSHVYASPMTRTQTTENLILAENQFWKTKRSRETVAGLNDMDIGDLEGMTLSNAEAQYGKIKENAFFGVNNDPNFVSPIHAETMYAYGRRMNNAMQEIVLNPDNQNKKVLVVTHAAARFWIQQITGNDTYKKLDNASLSILYYDEGRWTVKDYNDTNYVTISEKTK